MTVPNVTVPAWASHRARLSFEQTVPRALAHRRAVGEVFIVDSVRLSDEEFLLATEIPRSHRLWSDRRYGHHDPLMTVEAGRQGLFVLLHRYFGIPFGVPMVLREIGFEVSDVTAYLDGGGAPPEAVFRVRLTDRQFRNGQLIGMSFRGELAVQDVPALVMSGAIMVLARDDYDLLRAHARARKPIGTSSPSSSPPLDAALVGRFDPRNVVIGPPRVTSTEGEAPVGIRCPVRVDQGHPSFFDHPLDHVPGPLILEVYRQAALVAATRSGALAAPYAVPTGCQVTFSDYAELEAPVECTAAVRDGTATGPVAVDLGLYQFGARIATAAVTLMPVPGLVDPATEAPA